MPCPNFYKNNFAIVRQLIPYKMPKVISVHEYTLKAGVSASDFERAVHSAEQRGLFNLLGLESHYFVRALRGARRGAYAAVWVYPSRAVWENTWGSLEQPYPPEKYPNGWIIWEKEILAQYLDREPDRIVFTAYEEI